MKRAILLILVVALLLIAQQGQPVRISDDPSPAGVQQVLGYSGTNLIYLCASPSFIPNRLSGLTSSLSAASSTQASPTVIAVTHQFAIGSRPDITISGVTGTGYATCPTAATCINREFIATVVDSTHISIPFDSSLLSAATWTSATFTTTAPRLNQAEWAVKHLVYDGSSNLIGIFWEGPVTSAAPQPGGSTGYRSKCSDASGSTIGIQ